MPYRDLQAFIEDLEQKNLLRRVKTEVSQDLEIAEIADRTVKKGGPALLFENVKGHSVPVAINLFGTNERMALGLEYTESDVQAYESPMHGADLSIRGRVVESSEKRGNTYATLMIGIFAPQPIMRIRHTAIVTLRPLT